MRFKEQVVLITGAARGIGWGIAQKFASEGAKVVLNDIEDNLIKARSQELMDQGFNAWGIRADVSKGSEVEKMINDILDLSKVESQKFENHLSCRYWRVSQVPAGQIIWGFPLHICNLINFRFHYNTALFRHSLASATR